MLIQPSYSQVDAEVPSLVTLDDVKRHLSLFSDTSYDTLLMKYLAASLEYCGRVLGQPLGATDIKVYYKQFGRFLELPYGHQDGITSVQYYNASNTLTTVASSTYFVDDTVETPVLTFSTIPNVNLYDYRQNPVVVTMSSDSLSTSENEVIQQAVLLIVADWFKYRENVTTDTVNRVPVAAHTLLQSYKRALL